MPSPSCCGSRGSTASRGRRSRAGGVYHITFERDTPIQLVRIALPSVFGVVSRDVGSHYRCTVRLLAWNGLINGRSKLLKMCRSR